MVHYFPTLENLCGPCLEVAHPKCTKSTDMRKSPTANTFLKYTLNAVGSDIIALESLSSSTTYS